jgi:hypothetical protein
MTEPDAGRVECYSGHTYAQEPKTVIWGECRYPVVQIQQRWRTPEGPAFFVVTETGMWFELHYHEIEARWTIRPLSEQDGAPAPANLES